MLPKSLIKKKKIMIIRTVLVMTENDAAITVSTVNEFISARQNKEIWSFSVPY